MLWYMLAGIMGFAIVQYSKGETFKSSIRKSLTSGIAFGTVYYLLDTYVF